MSQDLDPQVMKRLAYERYSHGWNDPRALWPGIRAFWGRDGSWELHLATQRLERREHHWNKRVQYARQGHRVVRWVRVDEELVKVRWWRHDPANRRLNRLWRLRRRRSELAEEQLARVELRSEFSHGIDDAKWPNLFEVTTNPEA